QEEGFAEGPARLAHRATPPEKSDAGDWGRRRRLARQPAAAGEQAEADRGLQKAAAGEAVRSVRHVFPLSRAPPGTTSATIPARAGPRCHAHDGRPTGGAS